MTVYVDDAHIMAAGHCGAFGLRWPCSGANEGACEQVIKAMKSLDVTAWGAAADRPEPEIEQKLAELEAGTWVRRRRILSSGTSWPPWWHRRSVLVTLSGWPSWFRLAVRPKPRSARSWPARHRGEEELLLALARRADPARAPLCAEHASRVHAAARARAADVAGPTDPRPLNEIIRARLEAAGITADDPGVQFIACWNQARFAAAARQAEPQPGHAAQAEPGPAASPGETAGARCEAGS
jgi:hypothetical protein